MNILILNYEYPPLGGGAAPMCQAMAETFAKLGHDVEVVTMGYKGLPSREVRNGVRIRRVPALRRHQATCETVEMLSYVLSAFPRALWRLWRRPVDVVHCHFIIPTGLLAWLLSLFSRTPYVLTAHGSDVPGYNPDRFTVEHRFLKPLLRMILGRAAAATAPSKHLIQLIHDNIGPYEVAHIPNASGASMGGTKEKEPHILMMSRLLPRKGFQYVLEALEGHDNGFEIHIAGDGPMREALEAQAVRLKMPITFHGWVEQETAQFNDLYERASIFCLPSENENAPVSLIEAMRAGLAIITSNVGGCPEVVGDAALLVPPRDAPALREALTTLMNDAPLRRSLGERARQRALEQFGLTAVGQRYETLFESLRPGGERNDE